MMLFEQPLPILIVGIVVLAILGGVLVHTGRREVLYGLIGATLFFAALLAVEYLVVTPGEEVELTLERIASSLERNDAANVLQYLSDQNPQLKQRAAHEMKRYRIREANVKPNLRVEVYQQRGLQLARARFNGILVVDSPDDDITNLRVARRFTIGLQYEDGKWKVADYSHEDPIPRAGEEN